MAGVKCLHCGTRTKSSTRLCHYCRIANPTDRELPPGRWVGGLVKRYVEDVPPIPKWRPSIHPLGHTCECGCLLIDADERCPACLVWAELDAIRATWNLTSKEAA